MTAEPPRPSPRPPGLAPWRIWARARDNLFAALPARLDRAWMAELRLPLFRSVVIHDPALVRRVLVERPEAFPKHPIYARALGDLLGRSIFVTDGAEWERQRRMIDPAFEGGRLRAAAGPMAEAAEAMARRLDGRAGLPIEIEAETAHATADVIFRTLVSRPIEAVDAGAVFAAFRRYQSLAPMVSLGDLLGLPGWLTRLSARRRARGRAAAEIRSLMARVVAERQAELAAGTEPDDLASALIRARDPATGRGFGDAELADQLSVFFLAGHETSAAALAWALWLLACAPEAQTRVAAEVAALPPGPIGFGDLRRLPYTRDVFRETLRLYAPVPMLVRRAAGRETMRGRRLPRGTTVVISPWHLGRHRRIWDRPDAFEPERWQGEAAREGWLPFSAGPRVCPGAGFAMQEGVLFLATLVRRFQVQPAPGRVPEPVARLTVRARDGLWLILTRRP